jgi:hypothetical protein
VAQIHPERLRRKARAQTHVRRAHSRRPAPAGLRFTRARPRQIRAVRKELHREIRGLNHAAGLPANRGLGRSSFWRHLENSSRGCPNPLVVTCRLESRKFTPVNASARWFEHFKETGHFPETVQAVQGMSMASGFKKLNALIDKMGIDKTREFLSKKMTVGDLNKMGYVVQGESKGTEVYGSAILGPKIGNGFYQNLSGNFDPLTFDLWWMRGWGRMTGSLVGDMPKEVMDKQEARLRSALGDRAPKEENKLIAMAHAIVDAHEKDFQTNRADYDSGKKVKAEVSLAAERFLAGRQAYAKCRRPAANAPGCATWPAEPFRSCMTMGSTSPPLTSRRHGGIQRRISASIWRQTHHDN